MDVACKLKFTRANENELPLLLALERTCFGTHAWSLGMVASELACPQSETWLVTDRKNPDVPLAYAMIRCIAEEGHIMHIAVRPGYRGAGVGRALMRFLIDRMQHDLYCEVSFLEVRAGNNAAISLYENSGFTQVGLRKNYYRVTGEDALIMARMLAEGREQAA